MLFRSSLVGFVVIFVLAYLLAGGETARLWQAASTKELFYEITPHNTLVAIFGPVFLWAVLAMTLSGQRYWQMLKGLAPEQAFLSKEASQTVSDIVQLRYLDGGGQGCAAESDKPTKQRRVSHQMVFLGFMLCLASTSVATQSMKPETPSGVKRDAAW